MSGFLLPVPEATGTSTASRVLSRPDEVPGKILPLKGFLEECLDLHGERIHKRDHRLQSLSHFMGQKSEIPQHDLVHVGFRMMTDSRCVLPKSSNQASLGSTYVRDIRISGTIRHFWKRNGTITKLPLKSPKEEEVSEENSSLTTLEKLEDIIKGIMTVISDFSGSLIKGVKKGRERTF